MKELKEQIRDCDLTQFKNYDEYIKYVQELALNYMRNHKDLTIEELQNLLKEMNK